MLFLDVCGYEQDWTLFEQVHDILIHESEAFCE